ncbi:hypothetical protein, partial [Pseudomonas sp. SWRI18]|uniref:hypothetical protein n=1 Tax=Pseudomonas sp. SWRI18 TaxID=2753888 RepID=UPI001EE1569E
MPLPADESSIPENVLHHTKKCRNTLYRFPRRHAGTAVFKVQQAARTRRRIAKPAISQAIFLRKFPSAQNKTPSAFANGVSEFNLDDDLLSHGETPH